MLKTSSDPSQVGGIKHLVAFHLCVPAEEGNHGTHGAATHSSRSSRELLEWLKGSRGCSVFETFDIPDSSSEVLLSEPGPNYIPVREERFFP